MILQAFIHTLNGIAAQKQLASMPPISIEGPAKTEKSLAFMGLFVASNPNKKRKNTDSKMVTVVRIKNGEKKQLPAQINPSRAHGYPTNAHLKKLLAFFKICQAKQYQDRGVLTNPIWFTRPQFLTLLKHNRDSGKNRETLLDFIDVLYDTEIVIFDTVYDTHRRTTKKKKHKFRIFSEVRSLEITAPSGHKAEARGIDLPSFILNNFNAGFLLPVDYEQFLAIQNNIAQALILPLKVWIFAAQKDGARYSDIRYDRICSHIDITQYSHGSRILQQLRPSLDELRMIGICHRWELMRTADSKAWKVRFWLPLNKKQLKTKKQTYQERGSGANTETPGTQQNVYPKADGHRVDPALVKHLGKWGISEPDAQKLLGKLPTDQPVEDQLEYVEQEIRRLGLDQDPKASPAGFIVKRLKENAPVPEHFVSARKKQDTEEQSQRRREAQAALERAYEDYLSDLVFQHIRAHYSEEECRAYRAAKKQTLAQHIPNHTEEMLSAMAEASIRQEFLQKISDRIPFDQFCEEKKRSAIAEK